MTQLSDLFRTITINGQPLTTDEGKATFLLELATAKAPLEWLEVFGLALLPSGSELDKLGVARMVTTLARMKLNITADEDLDAAVRAEAERRQHDASEGELAVLLAAEHGLDLLRTWMALRHVQRALTPRPTASASLPS